MILSPSRPRLIVTGIGGYGRIHLANAQRLAAAGRVEIVALVDPAIAENERDGIPLHATLEQALAAHPADVVIVATPLDTHATLCEQAMRAGADVLLEKPPVPTADEFERLLVVQRETGRVVQVGFQSLGSEATPALADDRLGLGRALAVSATGLWSRRLSYWKRARWAGRRSLDGRWVVDGVATNPLAHAVATALRIAGYDTADSVAHVETDLYRVNAIDADDTSVIRITGDGLPTVTCALTLCAPPQLHDEPNKGASVVITGERASASFSYQTDAVTIADETTSFGRVDLLENLLAHRRDGVPLIVPLESTGAFVRVVEAIRLAPEPMKIDPSAVTWHDEGDDAYPVVEGIEDAVLRAAQTGSTFTESGLPWAHDGRDGVIATGSVRDIVVAQEVDGVGTIPFSSPHPYLHPVRTLGGVTVTATHPADHDWHTGIGFAVQDAGGINFWGGRTYVRGEGYQRLDDHGTTDVTATRELADGVEHELAWRGPDGALVLNERRRLRWAPFALPLKNTDDDGPSSAWLLEFETRLVPASDGLLLGSPGSKGRDHAGYGGFFWRFPTCSDVRVFTTDASGEDAVNGSVAPWLAWAARFDADPEHRGEASIVLTPADAETARDPWFVRVRDYPGIGSAIAWDTPTAVPEQGLTRRFRAAVIDGCLEPADATAAASALAGLATGAGPATTDRAAAATADAS